MIQVREEPLAQILGPALDELLLEHWREIALYQEQVPLAPDFARYRALAQNGALVCLTARDNGALIGYAAWILSAHLHYRRCKVALNDVIYVSPEFRSGSTAGLRLIKESERCLGELGVNRIIWHIKPKNDWRAILERLGYAQEEFVMGKLIEGH